MLPPDWWQQAEPDVHSAVGDFAQWVRTKIANERPHRLIAKNPFLFRARAPNNAAELADRLIDAFLSSSEETRFGDILEDIAVAVCRHAKGGRKSSTEGIDLEYDAGRVRTIVSIKSGPNWGNSSQHKRLVANFQAASRVLRQGRRAEPRCIEGICYGPSGIRHLATHDRITGNAFWEEISDWPDAGRAVLAVIEQHAGNGLLDVRRTTRREVVDYLQRTGAATEDGGINWERLFDLTMMPTRERPK